MKWLGEHWSDLLSFFGGVGGTKLFDYFLNRKSIRLSEEAKAIKNLRDLLEDYRMENDRLRLHVSGLEEKVALVNKQNALMLGVLMRIAPAEANEILNNSST